MVVKRYDRWDFHQVADLMDAVDRLYSMRTTNFSSLRFTSDEVVRLCHEAGFFSCPPDFIDSVVKEILDCSEAKSAVAFAELVDWMPTIATADLHASSKMLRPISQDEFALLDSKLPLANSKDEIERRVKMFHDFDPNGNGFLSLAEIDKGVRDVLQLPFLFQCKPALMRAYQSARRSEVPSKKNHFCDYITASTFRTLLWYLRAYFELWLLFSQIDANGDRRVTKEELRAALPLLKDWGLTIAEDSVSLDKCFREIDRDGGGMILFDEFAAWALEKGIHAKACE
jgi:Ca2+-binding EF-hand superfamily protein